MRLILLFAATATFGGTPRVATDTAVVVFLGDHRVVPVEVWFGVQTLVTSIFASIDVPVFWQNGKPRTNVPPNRLPIFVGFSAEGRSEMKEEQRLTCSAPAAIACSWPPDTEVIVMYERVRLHAPTPRRFQLLLGHAIAHEIAHVLAARAEHSESGIMKDGWTTADIYLMHKSALGFTQRDIQLIQKGFDYRRRRAESRQ